MENKEMVDFLGSIDVLDKNNLKKMIVMFGEEDTCSFLAGVVDSLSNSSSLSNKDKKALLTKFNYFIKYSGSEKERLKLQQEIIKDVDNFENISDVYFEDDIFNLDKVEEDVLDVNISDIHLFNLYGREMKRFELLGDEEVKYTNALLLKDKILDIVVDNEEAFINGVNEPMVDLRKVFASVGTKNDRDSVIKILSSYYSNSTKKESTINKIISYYLFEYNKLCSEVGVPSIDDLNNHFKKSRMYNIFNSYGKDDVLDINIVKEQLINYVQYMNAREVMINHNLRLVISIAKTYVLCGIPIEDLVQEGNIGLMKAVDKFDANFGNKFSTYATWWIRQSISRMLADKLNIIRYPVHVVERLNKLSRIRKQFLIDYNRYPTIKELADLVGATEDRIREDLFYIETEKLVSLDVPIGEDDDMFLLNVIEDTNSVSPFQEMINLERKERINEALGMLSEREAKVLRMRFGIGDDENKGMTLEEIGKEFCVTRERIRQLEAKALRKLRHPSRNLRLRDLL